MKKWEAATIEAIEITETAFGPKNPNTPDSEKTQVTIDGVTGWEQKYGEADSSK